MKRFEIHIKEINLNEDLEPIEKKEVEASCIVDDKLTPTTEELVKNTKQIVEKIKEYAEHNWFSVCGIESLTILELKEFLDTILKDCEGDKE